MGKAVLFDQVEAVVSDDTTVETVIAEETVIQEEAVDIVEETVVEEAPVPEVAEEIIAEDETPEQVVEEPIVEEVVEVVTEVVETVVEDRFVIKVGNDLWLKSWFSTCTDINDACVLNSDWARGHYKRVTNIMHLKAEIVKL